MVGSLLAGLSHEMWQLVAARGIQGLGAGALFPIALAVIGDLFAPSERGRYQGLFGAVFGLSVLVGPAIGGLITDTIGWPFVFFFNLPVGAVVFALAWRSLPPYHPGGARPRIDYLGAALFTGALVPILVGLTNKQSADWSSPAVGGLILLGRRDPRLLRLGRVARDRADRAPRPVPQPLVHRLGGRRVPRGVRLLRDRRVPAALVPGRRGLVGDGVGLPDAAAPRRAHRQRRGVGPDRQPDGPLPAADVRRARRHGDRAVHAHAPAGGHAAAGPVGLDVRDRDRRRADVRRVHADRPEQRPGRAARDGDQQPDVLPAGRRDRGARDHRDAVRLDAVAGAAAPAGRRRASRRRSAGRWRAAARWAASPASATSVRRSSPRSRRRPAHRWRRSCRRSSTRSTARSRPPPRARSCSASGRPLVAAFLVLLLREAPAEATDAVVAPGARALAADRSRSASPNAG